MQKKVKKYLELLNEDLHEISKQSMVLDAKSINLITNPKKLSIPTYDLNPSVGHPSVIYIPESFLGYKYWMAYTPFPAEARENPCVVVSNDGENWINPPWFTNPLYSQADAIADGQDYNSDTHILLMKDENIGVYWRSFNNSTKLEKIHLKVFNKTTLTWSASQTVISTPSQALAPNVILEEDGTYTMFTVNTALPTKLKVQKRISNDGVTWGEPVSCVLSTGKLIDSWHINVQRVSDGYILLVCNSARTLNIYKSTDGINFNGSSIPFIKSSGSSWDSRGYYHSCFLVLDENPLKIWGFLNGMDGSGADEYKDVWSIGSIISTKVPIYSNRNVANIITNPNMTSGVNGVATGFTSANDSTITANYTMEDCQKIEITGGTVVTSAKVKQTINTINPTLAYTISALFKTLGDVNADIWVDWYNGSTYLSSSEAKQESSNEFELLTANVTSPANTTKCMISFGIIPQNIGDKGCGWFKEVIMMPI